MPIAIKWPGPIDFAHADHPEQIRAAPEQIDAVKRDIDRIVARSWRVRRDWPSCISARDGIPPA
ncbi:MAG: hypothetical protein AB7F35_29195 [Acetobacteraceae bacterium]